MNTTMCKQIALIIGALLLESLSGCTPSNSPVPEAHHDGRPAQKARHEHKAPHGGTAVELGSEEYHLELVQDASTGKLQAYVLDGELENFVRIKQPALELSMQFAGRTENLVLLPVVNNATGETVGDTSLFAGQAEWLKTEGQFDTVLKAITIRSKTYTNVRFNFPKGSDENAGK